jgi:hypothetical protein
MRIFDIKKDNLDFDFNYNSDETKNIQQQFSKKERIEIDDLRRVALWKINRVLEISDDTLEKLNSIKNKIDLKSDDKDSISVIKSLSQSQGIVFPLLSAILKFLRPDIYPIIDVRAYRALYGKKLYSFLAIL